MNDLESGEYAFAIFNALKDANWNVEGINQGVFEMPGPRGLSLEISAADMKNAFLIRLHAAFTRIGVSVPVAIPKNADGTSVLGAGRARLTVGSKPIVKR